MNTEQAFDLLRAAGVADELCIQTVRRWLRERKINYEGKAGFQETNYILTDTDQAIDMLKDAGVPGSSGIKVIKSWLHDGKIQKVGNKDQIAEYIKEAKSRSLLTRTPDQDKTIHDLRIKIKVQDEHIKGIEELHKTSVKAFVQQREKLQEEIAKLEYENRNSQKETSRILKENIDLRKELLTLKEELSHKGRRDSEQIPTKPVPNPLEYRQKLGLSKTAGQKEVVAGFKKLLKVTHPDHGGNAAVFHYVKTDYDHFKNNKKE